MYVTPRLAPDELPKVYSEDYWKSDSPKTKGYADYASDEHLYLKTFRRRLGFVRSGRLIAEGTAASLREMAGKDNIEEAFLYFAEEQGVATNDH